MFYINHQENEVRGLCLGLAFSLAPAPPCPSSPQERLLLTGSIPLPWHLPERSRCSFWLACSATAGMLLLSHSCLLCMPRHYVREPQELRQALPKSARHSWPSKESVLTFCHLLVFSTQESLLALHFALSNAHKSLTPHLLFPHSCG